MDPNKFEFRNEDAALKLQESHLAESYPASAILNLSEIQSVTRVSQGKAKMLLETCIWCLTHCSHSNGVLMRLDYTTTPLTYEIKWSDEIDLESVFRSYNQDDAIESGAEAIAIPMAMLLTDYDSVQRSTTSTGIDYWLTYKEAEKSKNLFLGASRLEVSGIMHETLENSVKSRLRVKLKQTRPSDGTFPAYVVIVEFSTPYTTMVMKNVNHE